MLSSDTQSDTWKLPTKAFVSASQFLNKKEIQAFLPDEPDDLQWTFELKESFPQGENKISSEAVKFFIVENMEMNGEQFIDSQDGMRAIQMIKNEIKGKKFLFKKTQNENEKNSLYGIAPRYTEKQRQFVIEIYDYIGVTLSYHLQGIMRPESRWRCIYELIRKLAVMHRGQLNDIKDIRTCHLDIKPDNIVSLFTDEDRTSLEMGRCPYSQTLESKIKFKRNSYEKQDRELGVFTFIDFDSSINYKVCQNQSSLKVNATSYYQCPTIIQKGQITFGSNLTAQDKFDRLAKCDVYALGVVILEILLQGQLYDMEEYRQRFDEENIVFHELVMQIMDASCDLVGGNQYYKIVKNMLNPNPCERWSIEKVLSEVYHEFFHIHRNENMQQLVIKEVISFLDLPLNKDNFKQQYEYKKEIINRSEQTKENFRKAQKSPILNYNTQPIPKYFRYKDKEHLQRALKEENTSKIVFSFFDFDVLSLINACHCHFTNIQALVFSDCKLKGIPLLKNFPSLVKLSILGKNNQIKQINEDLCQCYQKLIQLDLSLTTVQSFTSKSVQNIQCLKFDKCYSLKLPVDLPDNSNKLNSVYFQDYDSIKRGEKERIDLMRVFLGLQRQKVKVYEHQGTYLKKKFLQGKLQEMEMKQLGIKSKLSEQTADTSQQKTWPNPFFNGRDSFNQENQPILSKHISLYKQEQDKVEYNKLYQSDTAKQSQDLKYSNVQIVINCESDQQVKEQTEMNVKSQTPKQKLCGYLFKNVLKPAGQKLLKGKIKKIFKTNK